MQLVISHLKIKTDNQLVVNDFSITINQGELHVLMGPNGSGKSSLAKTIMGHPHYHVASGDITLGRRSLLALPAHKRAKLGLFLGFQQPSSLPGVSVFQLLKSLSLRSSSLSLYNRLTQKAAKLHLPPQLLDAPLNETFSGGEQKKIELLQFAEIKPKFAILDEPDTGLDVDALTILARHIQSSLNLGIGILLITHSPRLLAHLIPQAVHVIKSGCLIKSGSPHLIDQIDKKGYASITH